MRHEPHVGREDVVCSEAQPDHASDQAGRELGGPEVAARLDARLAGAVLSELLGERVACERAPGERARVGEGHRADVQGMVEARPLVDAVLQLLEAAEPRLRAVDSPVEQRGLGIHPVLLGEGDRGVVGAHQLHVHRQRAGFVEQRERDGEERAGRVFLGDGRDLLLPVHPAAHHPSPALEPAAGRPAFGAAQQRDLGGPGDRRGQPRFQHRSEVGVQVVRQADALEENGADARGAQLRHVGRHLVEHLVQDVVRVDERCVRREVLVGGRPGRLGPLARLDLGSFRDVGGRLRRRFGLRRGRRGGLAGAGPARAVGLHALGHELRDERRGEERHERHGEGPPASAACAGNQSRRPPTPSGMASRERNPVAAA